MSFKIWMNVRIAFIVCRAFTSIAFVILDYSIYTIRYKTMMLTFLTNKSLLHTIEIIFVNAKKFFRLQLNGLKPIISRINYMIALYLKCIIFPLLARDLQQKCGSPC